MLLLSLAAGTYYLAELAERFIKPERARVAPDLPDAFAEGVVLLRLNEQGAPVFRMSSYTSKKNGSRWPTMDFVIAS